MAAFSLYAQIVAKEGSRKSPLCARRRVSSSAASHSSISRLPTFSFSHLRKRTKATPSSRCASFRFSISTGFLTALRSSKEKVLSSTHTPSGMRETSAQFALAASIQTVAPVCRDAA